MHPSREKLRRLVEDNSAQRSGFLSETANHVKDCDFCREFCDDYRQYLNALAESKAKPIPDTALQLADRLFDASSPGRVFDLLPFDEVSTNEAVYLAADGTANERPTLEQIATLYCDDPDIVLNVIRDREHGADYLQVISDDPGLASGVLVQIPEKDRQFCTDGQGRASLQSGAWEECSNDSWQIKTPDAVFELASLDYDPSRVESVSSTQLTNDRGDKIDIRFEQRVEGNVVSLQVTEVGGEVEFEPLRVTVTHSDQTQILSASRAQTVEIGPVDRESAIQIRLYL